MESNIPSKLNTVENQSIYECADFFLTRFSLLPERPVDLSADELFQLYKNSTLFQEAIAVASSSLKESLQAFLEGNKADLEKIYPSLLKYYLRMTTRATPFGLFSAVGWGEFGDKTNLSYNLSLLDKKVKPDAGWLKTLVDYIHSHPEYVRHLKVMTNPNLIKKSGRVFFNKNDETSGDVKSMSIKTSPISNFIFYHASTSILYSDLESKLLQEFNQNPKEDICHYLSKIFQNGYLLSECSLSTSDSFSLEEFIIKFKDFPPLFTNLCIWREQLRKYQESDFGNGIKEFDQVSESFNSWKKMQHVLHVDAYLKSGTFQLNSCIKKNIEEAISILWLFSHGLKRFRNTQKYSSQFLEKYGTSRLVPLLELIDEHQGLGLPEMHAIEEQKKIDWQQILLANLKNKNVVLDNLIDMSFIDDFKEELKSAPLSIELFFELLADSQEDIDNGRYIMSITPHGGSLQAGSTFGRFLHLFSDAHLDQLKQFLKKEEALYSDVVFAEASFLTDNPRGTNVAGSKILRDYQICMHYHEPSEKILNIQDLYIGMWNTNLYIYSKKLGKKVCVTPNNTLNQEMAPPALKLLFLISQASFAPFISSIWKDGLHRTYLPRVSYKNIVLGPARWQFDPISLRLPEDASKVEVEKALKKALHSYEVPNHIYLVLSDHRILLDLSNQEHFPLIVQHYIKNRSVLFFESLGRNRPMNSDKGNHVAEFVVPCVKKDTHKMDSVQLYYPPTAQIQQVDRFKLPLGEWLYLKLFISLDEEETFLKQQLYPLISFLLEKKWIDNWFYVRYTEGKSHIRLRFQGQQEHLCQYVMPIFYQKASAWISEKMVRDFSIHTYEPEVERYGGPASIVAAENIFCADSECCLHILKDKGNLDLPNHILAALGIINFLNSFYPAQDDRVKCLIAYSGEKKLLAGFRPYSQKALKLISELFNENAGPNAGLDPLRELYTKVGEAVKAFRQTLESDVWNRPQMIIESIIHMHCNRLLGTNPALEKKAMVTALHLLEKMQNTRMLAQL